jgi:hypothetical protein
MSKGDNVTFKTPPAVAGVKTGPATDVTPDGITLTGSFTGNGEETSFHFEYGTTEAYGLSTDEESAGAEIGANPVSVTLEDFSGYTTYHYRLVATNSQGTTYGEKRTVKSAATPAPEVGSVSVSDITRTGATLTTTINPKRWPTIYLFEYGTSAGYGSETPISAPLSGLVDEPIEVSVHVEGLTPGSIHHVRAVATNLADTTNGSDTTFVTPDLPALEEPRVAVTGQSSARVSLRATANGSPATVHLEYGPSPAFGSSTAPIPIGDGMIGAPLTVDLDGLQAGTTYHLRAVAVSGLGRTDGVPVSFSTEAAPAQPLPPEPPACGKNQRLLRGSCACKKNFVKKRGKCVKRKTAKAKKKKKRHSAAGNKRAWRG